MRIACWLFADVPARKLAPAFLRRTDMRRAVTERARVQRDAFYQRGIGVLGPLLI